MKKIIGFLLLTGLLSSLAGAPGAGAAGNDPANDGGGVMARLYYQGHGSFRLVSAEGVVLYVDPYAGDGYDIPADIILVTHQHSDHNQVKLPARKEGCVVITEADALAGGAYQSFSVQGIDIETVMAGNKNHNPAQCVGYIITVDGISLYAAGDTSTTGQMAGFAARELDYALLPCDGVYNMDLAEAAACAELIGAKHNIPIHMKPGQLFDRDRAEAFHAPGRLIVAAGTEITLEK